MSNETIINKIIEKFRANPMEWEFSFGGRKIIQVKNTHGRKVDSLNNLVITGCFILFVFALASRSETVFILAIVVFVIMFIAVGIFNGVTLFKGHPMHEQEETSLLYDLASKLPELSEPKGKPLEEVIEGETLVQPVEHKTKLSESIGISDSIDIKLIKAKK